MLIRNKNGVNYKNRFDDYLNEEVFCRLRKLYQKDWMTFARSSIIPVEADMESDNLGIQD